MMSKMLFLIVLFALCSKAISEVSVDELTQGISKFSSDIYQQYMYKAGDENLVTSPLTVSMALTLLSQGTNGITFDELRKGLYLNKNKSIVADQFYEFNKSIHKSAGDSEFLIANQIYTMQGYQVKKDFEERAAKKFSCGIESINFGQSIETAQIINRFVQRKTKQRIKEFVTPEMFDGNTRIFLLSAVYLKAKWQNPFRKGHSCRFFVNETYAIWAECLKMQKMVYNFGYIEELDATALEIPYKSSNFTFFIILPNERFGLTALEARLKHYDLTKVFDHISPKEINMEVPKFKVETEINLNGILKNLSMTRMYTAGADLSGLIDTKEPLQITDVIHKAYIEINEEGTEGAATLGIRAGSLIGNGRTSFYANHPFVYHVWDKENKIPILSGHIKNIISPTTKVLNLKS